MTAKFGKAKAMSLFADCVRRNIAKAFGLKSVMDLQVQWRLSSHFVHKKKLTVMKVYIKSFIYHYSEEFPFFLFCN